ncbi:hypothetical protein L1049_006553 [Liquidambar formosana]|uniref:Uncharacterized protein n=1 Tax=Liquidambar formosana TaxID=63359 RepID=A0AAP0WRI8_LIQFO
METSKEKLELIHLAIHQLIEEKKKNRGDDDDDDHLLLSRLLSQLESLKGDGSPKQPDPSDESVFPAVGEVEKREAADEVDGGSSEAAGTEEIVKELRKVERQNSKTHWLLSILIIFTVAWHLSEVSLILKVKRGLHHPFRSLGGFLTGMLKGRRMIGQDAEKLSSFTKRHQIEAPPLPLKIPEFPHLELPSLDFNEDD